MTDTPKKIIVDCSTGEATEVALTAEEIAQMKTDRLAYEAQQAAQAQADADRAALKASAVKKLTEGKPLTADEAALLVI